jgi:hypothetical protein
MFSERIAMTALLGVVLMSAGPAAQWVMYRAPGVPRLQDGTLNSEAPTPRRADGTVLLDGVWTVMPDITAAFAYQRFSRFAANAAADSPGGAPLTAWGQQLRDARRRRSGREGGSPAERCLPRGVFGDMVVQSPFKVITGSGVVAILFEEFNHWRQIFADGRRLPVDPQPAWFGYSIGRWDKDTFVVESAGFKDEGWLDGSGTPHSDALHLTERYSRPNFGHLEIQFTFEDARAYTRPWSATVRFQLAADTDLLDYQCENEKWTSTR